MKKVNILLVDDDDICQLIGSKAILSMGLANEVHYAHNDVDKAHASGIKYYITKPLTEEKIKMAILQEFKPA